VHITNESGNLEQIMKKRKVDNFSYNRPNPLENTKQLEGECSGKNLKAKIHHYNGDYAFGNANIFTRG
jgi:hypothetical protein